MGKIQIDLLFVDGLEQRHSTLICYDSSGLFGCALITFDWWFPPNLCVEKQMIVNDTVQEDDFTWKLIKEHMLVVNQLLVWIGDCVKLLTHFIVMDEMWWMIKGFVTGFFAIILITLIKCSFFLNWEVLKLHSTFSKLAIKITDCVITNESCSYKTRWYNIIKLKSLKYETNDNSNTKIYHVKKTRITVADLNQCCVHGLE